jgi:hypothetical protein
METSLIPSPSSLIAGFTSGACGTIVGHPLDTLKVRMQLGLNDVKSLSSAVAPETSSSSFSLKLSTNYMRSLYRGVLPPLMTSGIMNSLNFAIFEKQREILLYRHSLSKTSSQSVFLSSATAGAVISLVTSPIGLVKVQRQKVAGISTEPRGYIEMIRSIAAKQGLGGFYRGFTPMLWMESCGRGFYMVIYFNLKPWLSNFFYGSDVESESLSVRMTAAAVAGCVSWISVYPVDVIKSKLQADVEAKQYKNFLDCIKQTYQLGGLRALTRGISYTLIRAAPTAATVLPVYEYVKDFLERK